MTKPRINVTLKTTQTLGKIQVCEYVPLKSKPHLLWPSKRRGIKIKTSHIRWGQVGVCNNRGLGLTKIAKGEYCNILDQINVST